MTNPEFDAVVSQVKDLTSGIDDRLIAPAMACCAVELLANAITCKHEGCFTPGLEILVKLMAAHALVVMKRENFERDETDASFH